MKSGFETKGPNEPAEGKSVFAPPALEEMARLFPQLEIIELLGHGGMGAVYKARQPRLNRFVALKILSPEKQSDPQFAERFEREARALASLAHPNIVTIYDFGEVQGHFYLLMEFVDGLTLRKLLQARKLSPAEAIGVVPEICAALQYAHEQGVIHRDIKPENILLDKKGRVKIADFGIAKIMDLGPQDLSLTGAKDVVGTPHYMAPEQIEKPQAVDGRADIYSLGVVFYEMLTGELPLGKFQPPSHKVRIDVRLDEVVLHALEKEPDRRYQHANEVKTAVETISSTAPPIAKTFPMRGRLWPAVGITAVVLALLAVAAVFLSTLKVRQPLEQTPLTGIKSGTATNPIAPPETRRTMLAEPSDQASADVKTASAQPAGLVPRDLANEFETIKAIEVAPVREPKLVRFAKDAARAGDYKMVELALETIEAANFRDDAAVVCARLLAKAGKHAEADEIAKTIADAQLRQHVLAQLTTDPPSQDTNAPSLKQLESNSVSGELAARFKAIKAIEAWPIADRELGQFAKEAARAGDAKMTELSLETILSAVTRDEATIVCIRLLAKAGKLSEANEVAKAITWPETRRIVLAQLISDPPSVRMNAPPAKQLSSPEQMRAASERVAQFKALDAIQDWTVKDLKLAQFAKEAARAGDAKMTELSLETIFAVTARDPVAITCARLLAKAGEYHEASEVAKDIMWPEYRRTAQAQLSELLPADTNTTSLRAGTTSNSAPDALVKEFKTLQRIEDSAQRDSALVQFAKDAASAGNVESAELALDAIISTISHDAAAAACARLLDEAGQRPGAVEVAKTIVSESSRQAVLSELKEPEPVSSPPLPGRKIETITSLVKGFPADIAAAINTKDFAKAQSLAAEATRQNPKFAEAWAADGLASARLGQVDRARQAYERALLLYQDKSRENPSDANSVLQQIFLLTLLDRSTEAAALLENARKSYPDDEQLAALARHFSELRPGWTNWTVKSEKLSE
jgi:tRNA A-37 threonylcarbamoyl transferase component Bud32/tetratricopeptide (TPR) repeat protein